MGTDLSLHPERAFFSNTPRPPLIAACDHYAGSEKLITKSLALQNKLGPRFDITCDLEDGAHIGADAQRREMAIHFVNSPENRFGQVGIRVNEPNHPSCKDDIKTVIQSCGSKLAHLTVPKVTSVRDVRYAALFVKECSQDAGLNRVLPLHILIETHGAVRDAWEIAQVDGVRSLEMGLMDFISDHHGAIPASAMLSPGQFEHPLVVRAKTEIAAAACAFGKIAAHNVTPNLSDPETTRSDADMARRHFGFTRMWSIHPAQIEPILAGMQPDSSEVALAEEILLAGLRVAWAPIRHRDRLHDRASFRYYWCILRRAQNLGASISEESRKAFFSTGLNDASA